MGGWDQGRVGAVGDGVEHIADEAVAADALDRALRKQGAERRVVEGGEVGQTGRLQRRAGLEAQVASERSKFEQVSRGIRSSREGIADRERTCDRESQACAVKVDTMRVALKVAGEQAEDERKAHRVQMVTAQEQVCVRVRMTHTSMRVVCTED